MLIADEARGVTLEVLVEGSGPDVVLVPSAMRGAADFALLQAALTSAGYRSLAMNPRCAGRSTGPLEGLTLYDIADDVAFVVNTLAGGKAHLVGHALGNIGVRATASFRPEVARHGDGNALRRAQPRRQSGVAGGHRRHAALPRPKPPREERLRSDAHRFLRPGQRSLGLARPTGGRSRPESPTPSARSIPNYGGAAGEGPILVIQPLNDAMASTEAGRATAAALGARCTYVEVGDLRPRDPARAARGDRAACDCVSGHEFGLIQRHRRRIPPAPQHPAPQPPGRVRSPPPPARRWR